MVDWLRDLTFFLANLVADTNEIKSNTTKSNMHLQHRYIYYNMTKLKPGLVTSYNIHPGHRVVLFLRLIALEPKLNSLLGEH